MAEKLLVVDDSSTDRMIIRGMLHDYDVLTAENGLEALRQIEANPDISLIILDLNMPVMNGFQVLDTLNQLDQNKRMRAIILTNYNELDKEIEGLQSGAVDFIRKPVNMESLRVRIKIHLELLKIQKLYEQTLFESSLTLNTLLEQAPIGIALSYDAEPNGRNRAHTVFNSAYEKITGRTREELIALGWGQITHPDDLDKEMEKYRSFQAGETDGYSMEKRFIRPDGSVVWVYVVLALLNRRSDIKHDHLCLIQDITERKAVENALFESERSKSVLLANLPGMAYRCDYNRQWTMRFVSDGCYNLTGYPSDSLLKNDQLSFNDLIVPEYRDALWEEWKRVLSQRLPFKYEYEIFTATGQRKWVLEMGQGVFGADNEDVQALEGIIIDITDRKMQEIKLKHISEIDSLTELHNRMYMERVLTNDAMQDHNGSRAVVLLSLRKMNNISLIYGYSFCEKVIKELARSLVVLANENRGLFQISFERFAFYFKSYEDADELKDFCRAVIKIADGIQILRTVGGGIGVLEYKGDQFKPEDIIRNASMAAEHVTENDVFGCRFFDHPMETAVRRDTEIKKELIELVNGSSGQQLYLQYQPIFNLKTNQIVEYEALARLRSNNLGAVSPMEFIPIAEETQLIVPIGKSVLTMACAFQKRLQEQGHGNIRVFVNVSAIQLVRNEFMDDFLTILQEYQVAPKNIGMEITESVLINNFLAINKKLEAFRELGVKISIDDFGTGYSSLNREREMNVDYLKIDKSFIDGLMYLPPEASISGDIISMGHRLGHTVVAEGVEYEKQKQYLLEHDCDLVQGYYFSRPLDEEQALAMHSGETR